LLLLSLLSVAAFGLSCGNQSLLLRVVAATSHCSCLLLQSFAADVVQQLVTAAVLVAVAVVVSEIS